MGQSGVSWSYSIRASSMLTAWKVTCKQQHPIPNPMQSMYMWSGLAALFASPSSPRDVKSSTNGVAIFVSRNTETISTFVTWNSRTIEGRGGEKKKTRWIWCQRNLCRSTASQHLLSNRVPSFSLDKLWPAKWRYLSVEVLSLNDATAGEEILAISTVRQTDKLPTHLQFTHHLKGAGKIKPLLQQSHQQCL